MRRAASAPSATRAVEPLIALLNDPEWTVRKDVANALGLIGEARAVDPLLARLANDEASWVRVLAAMSLGRIGDARAVPALVRAMRDDDALVHSSAAGALGDLGWKPKDDVERQLSVKPQGLTADDDRVAG